MLIFPPWMFHLCLSTNSITILCIPMHTGVDGNYPIKSFQRSGHKFDLVHSENEAKYQGKQLVYVQTTKSFKRSINKFELNCTLLSACSHLPDPKNQYARVWKDKIVADARQQYAIGIAKCPSDPVLPGQCPNVLLSTKLGKVTKVTDSVRRNFFPISFVYLRRF